MTNEELRSLIMAVEEFPDDAQVYFEFPDGTKLWYEWTTKENEAVFAYTMMRVRETRKRSMWKRLKQLIKTGGLS